MCVSVCECVCVCHLRTEGCCWVCCLRSEATDAWRIFHYTLRPPNYAVMHQTLKHSVLSGWMEEAGKIIHFNISGFFCTSLMQVNVSLQWRCKVCAQRMSDKMCWRIKQAICGNKRFGISLWEKAKGSYKFFVCSCFSSGVVQVNICNWTCLCLSWHRVLLPLTVKIQFSGKMWKMLIASMSRYSEFSIL